MSTSGKVATFKVEMPVNDDGLFPLQCPQSADHRFAVKIKSSDGCQASEPEVVHCPYCGHQGEQDAFYTPGQRRRLDDVSNAIADQLAAEMAGKLTNAFRGSRHITVSHNSRPPVIRQLHTYVPEPSRRTVTCGSCGEICAVYGIALYCVACGQLSPAECFAESLGVERRMITHLADLPPEMRDQMEADGVLTRTHENSVKTTFTALEVLLDQVFRSRVPDAAAVLRRRGNVFQRLPEASELYETHLAVSLSVLDGRAWDWLLGAAALRHLLTHSDGIVDDRYLRAVPASRLLPGQRVHVGLADAELTLSSAAALVEALLGALDIQARRDAHGPAA